MAGRHRSSGSYSSLSNGGNGGGSLVGCRGCIGCGADGGGAATLCASPGPESRELTPREQAGDSKDETLVIPKRTASSGSRIRRCIGTTCLLLMTAAVLALLYFLAGLCRSWPPPQSGWQLWDSVRSWLGGGYDCSWSEDADTWPEKRRNHCCLANKVGCPDMYKCEFVSQEEHASWSMNRRSWCCEYKRRGCPRDPFAATTNTTTVTTTLAPTTTTTTLGTTTTAKSTTTLKPRYDCYVGQASNWPMSQRQWCCDKADQGCDTTTAHEAPSTTTTTVTRASTSRATTSTTGPTPAPTPAPAPTEDHRSGLQIVGDFFKGIR